MPARCGYLTVASTKPRYLEMAVDLALSLREHDAGPVALVLGEELRGAASSAHLAVFDTVLRMPDGYPLTLGKLGAMTVTPYERTLFIDADCLALGALDSLWARLEHTEFALQGRYLAREEDRIHHGFSTAMLMRRFALDSYFKSNSGIMYFSRDRGAAVAAACMALRRGAFADHVPIDETLLGIVAAGQGIEPIPPPQPMPWWASDVAPGDARFKLIHFVNAPRAETMQWLMDNVRRRRAAAGLPPDRSVAQWHWKVSQVNRVFAARRRRAAGELAATATEP